MSSDSTVNSAAISHSTLDQNTSMSTVSQSDASSATNPGMSHRVQAKLSDMDKKSGIGAKANEIDQRYGISEAANKVARQVGDVASHMGAALSGGHVGHAVAKSSAAAAIGEAEFQKHKLGADGADAAIARDHPHGHEGNH